MITVENKTSNEFTNNNPQQPQEPKQPKPQSKLKSTVKEWTLTIIYAVLFSTLIKSFFYENYKIPSGSMNPTLLTGDRILVNKFHYGYTKYSLPFGHHLPFKGRTLVGHTPQYGDVVVFAGPQWYNKHIFYIKRIVGLPGDKVQIKNGEVIVNDKKLDYAFNGSLNAMQEENQNPFDVKEYTEIAQNKMQYKIFIHDENSDAENTSIYTVPENSYFCMGDNRDNSKDSRFLKDMGFIPFENIVGKAEIIMFSFSNKSNPFLELNNKRFWKKIPLLGFE
jgi:signal peptidase I